MFWNLLWLWHVAHPNQFNRPHRQAAGRVEAGHCRYNVNEIQIKFHYLRHKKRSYLVYLDYIAERHNVHLRVDSDFRRCF